MSETEQNPPAWPNTNDSPTQVVRLSREEKFQAWVGRREKLLRIAAEVDKALASAYKDMLAERGLSPSTSRVDRDRADRLANQYKPVVTVIAGKGRMKRSGDLEAILNDMDTREIECITMGNGNPYSSAGEYPEIYIQFGQEDSPLAFLGDDLVQLRVTGPDRQWVGGMFDLLAGEIRKDVPWWAIMRSAPASILLALLLSVGALPLIPMLVQRSPNDAGSNNDPVANVLMALFLGMLGFLLLRPLLRRLFPAVEVLEAGANARGRQVLAITVGVITFGLGVTGVVLGFLAL